MIPLSIPHIDGNEWKYIKDCLDTNWVSSVGSYVDLFEERFCAFLQSKYSVVTMNGTAALTLALQALGIGPGDEVIVPSMTFIASVNPIKYVGAEPVFVDITEDTWVMDTTKIEELITERTKAIIPVHLYGNVVDMKPLMKIARHYNIVVIEDATEALGSRYEMDGRWYYAGTLGDFGAFSFNGNKTITTGGGGMLVSNSLELSKRAKHLSNQAKTSMDNGGFIHEAIGFNYRMPNILAAMGLAQLEKLQEFIAIKKRISELYKSYLHNVRGLIHQREKGNTDVIYWLNSFIVEDSYPYLRDEVINKLKEKGVESRPFFYPIHLMKPYREAKKGLLEVTNSVSQKGLNLPSSISLKEVDIEYICSLLIV